MKLNIKLYTWLIITIFSFNISTAIVYSEPRGFDTTIAIPESLASVSDTFTPSSSSKDKFVIHIKDVHCDYQVQKNISVILKQIIKSGFTSLVTLEGASGLVDTSIFSVIPDKTAKQSVCDQFIKNGFLTGSESLSIIDGTRLPFTLWGVEDQNLYLKNFQTFRNIRFAYQNIHSNLTKIIDFTTYIKTTVYTKELFYFDNNYKNLKNIKKRALFLHKTAEAHNISIDKYLNFSAFIRLIEKNETPLDYSSLEIEKTNILKHLKSTLSITDYDKTSELEAKFNIGSVSPYEYFSALVNLINDHDKEYPAITAFLNREKLKTEIRHDLLTTDLKNLCSDIKLEIIKTCSDADKNDLLTAYSLIERTSDLVEVHEQLFNLQLTDSELESLHNTGSSLSELTEQLSLLGLKLGLVDQINNLPSAKELKNIELAADHCEYFYTLANQRSKTMVDNLLKKMDEDNQNTAVLIAGGFHSKEIEKELHDRNIKYITVTPNAQDLSSSNYLNLMMDKQLDLTSPQTLPLAQYISFPVLCGTLVQKSGYFIALRKELAAGLLTYGNTPIVEYRKKLTDPLSLNMLDKLIALSGISVGDERITTIDTLVSDISPQKIADHILSYDNKKLNMEIRATDPYYHDSKENRRILASYLLAILEISAKVNAFEGSEKDLLEYIINNSISTDKTIIHSVASDKLNSLEETGVPAVKQRKKTQPKLEGLNTLALQIAEELAQEGLVKLPDSLTENDIKIGETNLNGLIKGGVEDRIWFEILIPTANGSTKIFHAKSSRFGDFEMLGIKAFKALKKENYRYFYSPVKFKEYFGFHVTEHAGDISSGEIDPASDNAADYAYHLGEALAEAHLLRLVDRNPNNLRVIMEDGKPVKVINIDLTNALTEGNIDLSYQAEPILKLLRQADAKGVYKQGLEKIALKFMSNFANSLDAMQKYYLDNKLYLEKYEMLSGSPRWVSFLKRLDPKLYDINPVIQSFLDLINDEFDLNLSIKSYETKALGVSEKESIREFVKFERFRRFNPEDDSIAAKLFINQKNNVFLKISPNFFEAIQQRFPMWRRHPRTIITNTISLILKKLFSRNPIEIGRNKIGDLVPPMLVFKTNDEINVTRRDKISEGYFQKGIRYTLGEAFKILTQQGKINEINTLIEKYFQVQLTMIKRGVLDRDPFLMQNYGIDEIGSFNVKCFDFGDTITFLPLALQSPLSKAKFLLSSKRLSNVVPPECVEYYNKRYKEVFNIKTIRTLWKTEPDVQAEELSLNLNRPIQITASTDMNAHESFHNFLEEEQFYPFSTEHSSISSDLYRSKDGRYYIKTQSSFLQKIKKRLPVWRESPITFFTNIIGDILNALSPESPNFIAREIIGDFVPPMLEFDYKKPVHVTKKHFIQKGYVQKGMKYPLDKVFARLTELGDYDQINAIIDRFFEIQTEMISRGVFDADILFYQNYGVDDIYSTDIKCFDFGRAYPFLPLVLEACAKIRKYKKCIHYLSNMLPPECLDHYKQRYNEVFTFRNVFKLWNTKKGVQAQTISISPIREDKFPDYLSGAYNTKDFVTAFLNDINMSNHTDLEQALIDILEKAKNSSFSLTIDDLVDDKVSYKKLLTTIASTRANLNHKVIGFSLSAATSISNHRTSAALMVAIQKTVFEYITDMPSEKPYKLPQRFHTLIESSL